MRKSKTLKDFNVGDWFYGTDGLLKQLIEKEEDGWCDYTDGFIRSSSRGDVTEAYDLTIHNKVIADNVQWYFREFSRCSLLTPKTSKQLENYCKRLMELDEDTSEIEYKKIWASMDSYMHDLKEHMSHFK